MGARKRRSCSRGTWPPAPWERRCPSSCLPRARAAGRISPAPASPWPWPGSRSGRACPDTRAGPSERASEPKCVAGPSERASENPSMLFRTTSMRTGEDNRIALMPPAFYSCSRSTFDMYRACYVFALALCSLVLRICLATWVNSGSGAVGRGLQSEDAVVVFVRSCGSVCNKQPNTLSHTLRALPDPQQRL